jgi:hypothetical protein
MGQEIHHSPFIHTTKATFADELSQNILWWGFSSLLSRLIDTQLHLLSIFQGPGLDRAGLDQSQLETIHRRLGEIQVADTAASYEVLRAECDKRSFAITNEQRKPPGVVLDCSMSWLWRSRYEDKQ